MLSSYARRAYGSAVIAAHLPGQKRAAFAARERIEASRDRNVRRIVAYAAEAVPYYRQWFRREGIDPRSIRGAAELDTLPLLERDLVRAQPRLFVAENGAARSGLSFRTSGSTGVPLEVIHDRRSVLANVAYGERERAPVIDVCGGAFRPREIYVGYQASTFKSVNAFYESSTLMPRPQRRFLSILEPIDRIVDAIGACSADVLVGYGGWMDLFFKTVAARDIRLPRLKMALYMGEALPHGGRAFIEQTFGIPVLSRYNAVEAFKIGFTCEQRRGFHLHEDLCHVRVVEPDGRPSPAAATGQVVISNLVNRGTVLLNYPLGDVAALSDETCPCGRTFKLISELEGRVEDILRLAGGRFLHPRAIWEVFKPDRDVFQYQLTQRDPQHYALTLVTIDEPSYRRAIAQAVPQLERLLGPGIELETIHRREIDRTSGGKFRAVVSAPVSGSGPRGPQ